MAHIHSVYDSDSHFAINPITRTITNMSSQKTTLMQFDHNSERFTFELPRYIEGHDMSTCNRVEVHYINVDANTKAENDGVYEVEDLQVSPEDDNMVICSWLISQNVTQLIGSVHFIVRFVCTNDDSKIDYAWNTAIFSGINVSTGMYNGESVVDEYPDVLQQWYDRFMSVGVEKVIDARNEAISDIESMTTEKAEFLSQTGGTIVSEEEPEGEHVDIWVNPTTEGKDIELLESSDIVHELSDDADKIPSVALLNKELPSKVASRNLANLTFENATIYGSSGGKFQTVTTGMNSAASPNYIEVTGGESYTLSWVAKATRGNAYIHEYKADKTYIKTTSNGLSNSPFTLTLDSECSYIRIHFYTYVDTPWEDIVPNNFQIELGTVATDYVKPLTIDNTEIDDIALADKMKSSGIIPNDDHYLDTLPSTEHLPESAWEYGVLSNDDGSETTGNPIEIRVRTKGYIQLHKGDKVTDAQTGIGIDVFEYDPITLEYLGGADGWQSSYTVQNDSFVRILVNNASKADMETVASRVTIIHNSNSQIKFIALPLDDMREWTDRLIDEKAEKDYVTKTKFSAVKNTLLKQSAHRGYRGTGSPECTAPAYIEAKKFGYDVGENDLRVTSDGVFVMAHGANMPSDKTVVIADNTYETLLNHNMGLFNGKEVKILTFEEWLILMKKIGLEPFVDIKLNLTAEQCLQAMSIVRKHGLLDKVTWCTNNHITLQGLRAAYPMTRLALLGWTTANANYVIENRPDLTVLYPQSTKVTAEVVENAHNSGVGIECWHCDYSLYGFTTEDAILAEIERVLELGVTGICLDTYLPCEYFIDKLNAEWGLE